MITMNRDQFKEATYSGLLGGALMAMLEMTLVPLFMNASAWAVPRMIAGIVLGQGAIAPENKFNMSIVLTGVIVHLILSVLFANILSFFIRNLSRSGATIVGVLFGLVLYFINFYVFTGLFPWFAESRNLVTVFSHLVYGGTTGYVFKALQLRHEHV